MSMEVITLERLAHSGAWRASAIVCGHLVRRVYIGYNKRDSASMFRDEIDCIRSQG